MMNRKGSALLIVLGVLSFLAVSAVAFSAYMRRARLPSSYLRRSVSSRQFAKAALARAIDEIDRAIANGAHPGIGGTAANTWQGRVFFNGGGEQSLVETTPTLTFEGLAYIPPPLVNEARYWSRKTPTAVWRPFGYDTGRFAYCALDVSDFFDVNRLVADYPRSSASFRRITAAHLFEDSNHTSAPSGADVWDSFMDKFRDMDEKTLELRFDSRSKMPLVSLADFNLALGARGSIGLMKSPFVEYIKNEPGSFYPAEEGAELDAYARMTFVTDGWFPRGVRTTTDSSGNVTTVDVYDLSDSRYQPFEMDLLKKDDPIVLTEATVFYKTQTAADAAAGAAWYDRLSGLGMAALADYLDANYIPISLAVPTTERVPMICGVEPKLTGTPNFVVKKTPDPLTGVDGAGLDESPAATERRVEMVVRWKIDGEEFAKGFMGGSIRALVAYPFLHPEDKENKDWYIDGKFSLFLTSECRIPFRTENLSDVLHLDGKTIPPTAVNKQTGVMGIELKQQKLEKFKDEFKDEEEAVQVVELRLDGGIDIGAKLMMNGNELLCVTYQWTQRREKNQSGGFTDWEPSSEAVLANPQVGGNDMTVKATTAIPALYGNGNKIGMPDEAFASDKLSEAIKDPNWSKKVYLNAAVWLRIKDAKGNVVDMVPANISDDAIQNNVNDPQIEAVQRGGSMKIDGSPWPVLRFDTDVEFDFGINGLGKLESSPAEMPFKQKVLMVPDPRHNHAPENWFAPKDVNTLSEQSWLDSCLVGEAGRDRDIFMATSDTGCLQSVYELAFVPRFTSLRQTEGGSLPGNCKIPPGRNWNNGNYAATADTTLNADLMWRTFDPIDVNRAAFDELPFTSEGTGMKVNPYSDSTNVLMAAFANTPLDWRHASTNAMDGATDFADMSVKDFNTKYAWNEYSTGGKFAWRDLKKVAGRMIERVREFGNWKTAWNNIEWYNLCKGGNVFPGVAMEGKTEELWDADRKFLYGFWRDCFDAKQQLFIVFVRAEPMMLGGGTADQLPPQLGARAVAVVWRDPTPTSDAGGYPHRTRILFYRPLD